jgi:hypothetical protein
LHTFPVSPVAMRFEQENGSAWMGNHRGTQAGLIVQESVVSVEKSSATFELTHEAI